MPVERQIRERTDYHIDTRESHGKKQRPQNEIPAPEEEIDRDDREVYEDRVQCDRQRHRQDENPSSRGYSPRAPHRQIDAPRGQNQRRRIEFHVGENQRNPAKQHSEKDYGLIKTIATGKIRDARCDYCEKSTGDGAYEIKTE